jgi:3-methyladenine DNA glycosylase AlkD
MSVQKFYDDFVSWCEQNADEATALKYARYFKESYDSYGMTQPFMNAKALEMLKTQLITPDKVMEAAPLFFKNPKYEATSIILMLLNRMHKNFTREHFFQIQSWFDKAINNWAHADMLGMQILPVFFKKNLVSLHDFDPWIASPFRFQRRCVPVTLIKSAKNGEDLTSLFKYIEPLMLDDERVVMQGTGWFLKECWQINSAETEKFLLKWKDRSPRLIYQIACEKMEKSHKLLFKKAVAPAKKK